MPIITAGNLLPKLLSSAGLVLTMALFTSVASSERRPHFFVAPIPDATPANPENETKCNYQLPQDFLIRSNYVPLPGLTLEERLQRSKLHRKAIAYRTKNYGYFEGFGQERWNRQTPVESSALTKFMGVKIRLNKRVIPALACVEQQLKSHCADTPYQPKRLSGLRTYNTFRSHEVSNHVYGIAIDIDPALNPCCGCMGRRHRGHPCRQEVDSIFDRMAMPPCWVHTFERFGFYWLGRGSQQDAMHFEFLGDPQRILKKQAD